MRIKLRNFKRFGLWAYLLASLMLGAGEPHLLGSFWVTAAGSFLGFYVLGLGVVYLGAYLQRNKLFFSAEVEFQEVCIIVRPDGANQLPEIKDWRWILAWQETRTHFFLRIKRLPRLFLMLSKAELSPEEAATLRAWLARPRPVALAAS